MCIDFVPSMAMFKSGLFSINIIYSDSRKRILLYVLCKSILNFLQYCNKTLHVTRATIIYLKFETNLEMFIEITRYPLQEEEQLRMQPKISRMVSYWPGAKAVSW